MTYLLYFQKSAVWFQTCTLEDNTPQKKNLVPIVCFIHSDVSNEISNEDLEDGEIEDDEEETQAPPETEAAAPDQPVPETAPPAFCDPVQQLPNTDVPPPRLGGSPGENLPGDRFLVDGSPPGPPTSNQEKFRGGRGRGGRFDRRDDRRGRRGGGGAGAGAAVSDPEGSNKRHLTEAEKSVMYLHKLERQEREKRERFKREQGR